MRRALGLAASLVTGLLILSGCGGADPATDPSSSPATSTSSSLADPGVSPTPTATTPSDGTDETASGQVQRIPESVFGSAEFTDPLPAGTAKWQPRTRIVGQRIGEVLIRRVPDCDPGNYFPPRPPVDSDVRDFASTIKQDGDLLVARQLTVYPTDAAAEAFAQQYHIPSCKPVGGRYTAFQRTSSFTPTQFIGHHQPGTRTVVGESDLSRRDGADVAVDVISTRENVVIYTRVVDTDLDLRRSSVLNTLDRYPTLVRAVDRQTDRSLAILKRTTRG